MAGLFKSGKLTSTSEENSTSTTGGDRTGRQSKLFKQILDQLFSSISAGPNVMQSDRDAMRTSVNKSYNAVAPRVESQLTARGFGNSGKMGSALKGIDLARANEIQSGESNLRSQAMQRYMGMLGLALPYTRPDSYTTTGTTTGSVTKPGPSLFDQIFGDIIGGASALGFSPFSNVKF